ncbi:hypothetical protein Shyd_42430 [Streptomyces hydrogenans]|uniref:Uncharacterized protein n=1 Tax=Streptomyces hydrogenans TaxID=1873719 RepID=A0ABQ3PCX6_9ACTN|nr:hypothetical protein [Streptomyces hydrogenans]GHI22872.1 hypothetical protein Shyd_42430 [Streptomyces hydrogenans]
MDTKHCAVDGWVDAIPSPGLRGTATFAWIVPTDLDAVDEDIHDTVVTCTSGDPRIVHELLNRIQPGDLLRVTGTLVRPPAPGEPALLVVDALEILDTALIPVLREMVLDRYGDYLRHLRRRHGNRCPSSPCSGTGSAWQTTPTPLPPSSTSYERANGRRLMSPPADQSLVVTDTTWGLGLSWGHKPAAVRIRYIWVGRKHRVGSGVVGYLGVRVTEQPFQQYVP